MRKILLIGGSGQLGSALQNTAKNFDFKIVAPVHDELDACDPENIDKFLDKEKADLLINASAYVKIPKCEDEPMEALRLNSVAVRDMARLSKKKNIRFVTYSTCYVFDGECNEPYAEDDRPNPLQMYGISKFHTSAKGWDDHPPHTAHYTHHQIHSMCYMLRSEYSFFSKAWPCPLQQLNSTSTLPLVHLRT